MKLIAAVDKNWGIGYENKLLISIPEDMKFFRNTTKNHIVIMGRHTLESFPGGKPLKNRINIVITRNRDYQKEDVIVVHSIDELKEEIKKYDSDELFVIGGGSIYKELLPYCDTAFITKIDKAFKADRFFPNLDLDSEWKMSSRGEELVHDDINYYFSVYKRI